MIKIMKLKLLTSGYPVQWYAWDDKDNCYYIRFETVLTIHTATSRPEHETHECIFSWSDKEPTVYLNFRQLQFILLDEDVFEFTDAIIVAHGGKFYSKGSDVVRAGDNRLRYTVYCMACGVTYDPTYDKTKDIKECTCGGKIEPIEKVKYPCD